MKLFRNSRCSFADVLSLLARQGKRLAERVSCDATFEQDLEIGKAVLDPRLGHTQRGCLLSCLFVAWPSAIQD
jgi:hypothetical protein